jgi:hypothetical protein
VTDAPVGRSRITDENGTIAAEWRAVAAIDCTWRPTENQAGTVGYLVEGEGGGRYVTWERYPHRRAYLKPTRRDPDPARARAAREKIASDLAHDLGVPVPPVVLSEVRNGSEERFVALSLVMFPLQWAWSQTKRFINVASDAGNLIRRTAYTAAAQGLVLDTWLAQPDHTENHEHNIIFGYVPGDATCNQLLFLDYAFSLGFGRAWENELYRDCSIAPFPRALCENLDQRTLEATVAQVEAFPEQTVREVVTRIPATHLAIDQRAVIIDGLVARRSLVRSALAAYLSGGAR